MSDDKGKIIEAPAVHIKPGASIRFAVQQNGPFVNLGINAAELEIDYETALRLAQMLRLAGKAAKAAAGDHSRSYHVIGNLQDAEQNYQDFVAPNSKFSS